MTKLELKLREFRLSTKDALISNSSQGNLLKWCITDSNNGRTIFIKTSSYSGYNNIWLYESYSEIIVSYLMEDLGIKGIIKYYPCKIVVNNSLEIFGCYSYSFLNDNESYISISHLQKVGMLENYAMEGISGYNRFIEEVSEYIKLKRGVIKRYVDKIICVDYLVLNTDRHFGNIGVVYDNKRNKIRVSPIFDCGSSLFATKNVDEFEYNESLDKYAQSKPFIFKHSEQIKLVNKIKLHNNSLEKTFDTIDSLTKYGMGEHRAESIKQMIVTRLNMYNSIKN